MSWSLWQRGLQSLLFCYYPGRLHQFWDHCLETQNALAALINLYCLNFFPMDNELSCLKQNGWILKAALICPRSSKQPARIAWKLFIQNKWHFVPSHFDWNRCWMQGKFYWKLDRESKYNSEPALINSSFWKLTVIYLSIYCHGNFKYCWWFLFCCFIHQLQRRSLKMEDGRRGRNWSSHAASADGISSRQLARLG